MTQATRPVLLWKGDGSEVIDSARFAPATWLCQYVRGPADSN